MVALDTPAAVRALAGSCSSLSRSTAEPTAGTAPYAAGWLVVEQPGPWGRDALLQSHLDTEVARSLAEQAEALPVRVLLVRRPGRHVDEPGPRHAWAAFTEPGRTWLRGTLVDDVHALLDHPLEALAAGKPPRGWSPVDEALVFVCTNARRDQCCALRGRPLAAWLAGRHPGRVWECSHLGGHRFAPTALVLPYGLAYGRLDEDLAGHVVAEADAGRVSLDGYRGRTCYEAPVQVAEARVRSVTGTADVDGVRVAWSAPGEDGRHRARVVTSDGQAWEATLERRAGPQVRPESCRKPAVDMVSTVVTELTEVCSPGISSAPGR